MLQHGFSTVTNGCFFANKLIPTAEWLHRCGSVAPTYGRMVSMRFRYVLSLILLLTPYGLSYAFADDYSRSYRQDRRWGADLKTLDDLTSSGSRTSRMEPSRMEPYTIERHRMEPSRTEPSRIEPSRIEPSVTKTAVRRSNNYELDFRVITNRELLRLRDKDPDLSLARAWDILARVNVRASYHIYQDIEDGSPLKVPYDFTSYKDWSPLPREVTAFESIQKSILIVKDIPFLGWYENGRLMGDSVVCIGKEAPWTKAGLFRIKEKDIDHVSRSYPNIIGEPAPMPYGLRIYDRVWIHGGDIPRGNCSHGCINLPLRVAEDLFHWADYNTMVLILNTLDDLDRFLRRGPDTPSRFAQGQNRHQHTQAPAQMLTTDSEEEENDSME